MYLDHLNSVLCVLMVEGMSVVVNVMLSDECNEPTPCIVQPIGTHGVEVMYFWCFCFRMSLVS